MSALEGVPALAFIVAGPLGEGRGEERQERGGEQQASCHWLLLVSTGVSRTGRGNPILPG
jgi:hypothetical protein